MKITSKFIVFIFAFILLISLSTESLKKKKKNLKKEKKSKKQILHDSILMDNSGYRSPIIVDSLSMGAGANYSYEPPSSPDIVYSGDVYYNGASNLNAKIIECNKLLGSTQCMASALCGWCGGSNSCVPGTPQGPLVNCPGKFAFSKANTLNAFNAGTINLNVKNSKNQPYLIRTNTPDFSSITLNTMN